MCILHPSEPTACGYATRISPIVILKNVNGPRGMRILHFDQPKACARVMRIVHLK